MVGRCDEKPPDVRGKNIVDVAAVVAALAALVGYYILYTQEIVRRGYS